jgi:plastocyanin
MRVFTKLTIGLLAITGLSVTVVGVAPSQRAGAQAAGPAITINDFQYDPADLAVKVGDTITVTNNDVTPHTVTAKDGSFNADVPANGTATFTVSAAGSFPYYCTYHNSGHNEAKVTAS